jgi:hypothetical protein
MQHWSSKEIKGSSYEDVDGLCHIIPSVSRGIEISGNQNVEGK